jgi:unsaturated rhamnogalacturonyl hydrolase
MNHLFQLLNGGSTLRIVGVLFLFLPFCAIRSQEPSYAVSMAESTLKNHPGNYGSWDYVTGTVLRGYMELWKITGEKKYYDYIKNTVDRVVTSDGSISGYILSDYNLDEIKEGCQLLFLYRETGLEKYKKAADLLRLQLSGHPRTSEGAFWHKKRYPWQIWLDGLYMGSPFYAEYGEVFNEPAAMDDVARQLLLTHKHLRDSVTGLYYHGWDEMRQQEWADSVTGQSPSFWGRAMGWYAMALVDALDYIPAAHLKRDSILMILNLFAPAIKNFQDSASGVWWQVVDQGHREGNYLESSVSCMFVYALAKAARLGYIDTSYRSVAVRGFEGILKEFITTGANGVLTLNKTCLTAGLGNGRDGSYEYYVNETSVVSNDGKAIGPFILAAIEIENPVYPPTGLKQDTTFREGVKLGWKDNAGNETGYLVYKYRNDTLDSVLQLASNCESVTDTLIMADNAYAYKVMAVNETDTSSPAIIDPVINYKTTVITSIREPEKETGVFTCYPNPARNSFTLVFTLSQVDKVCVAMTDVSGRTFKIIPARDYPSGVHSLLIDVPGISPGIYACTLTTRHSDSSQLLVIQ